MKPEEELRKADPRLLVELLEALQQSAQLMLVHETLDVLKVGGQGLLSGCIEAEPLVGIYERRSQYPWLKMRGFDVFLAALRNEGKGSVRLWAFHKTKEKFPHYLIATDVETKKLFGITAMDSADESKRPI